MAPWCLYSGLKTFSNKEHFCKIAEGTINEPIEKVFERISYEKPDIIGLSCYIWNIKSVIVLGKMLKDSFPESRIILGGPEVSYNAKDFLNEHKWCDFIVSGEGEFPFAALCDAIISDGSFNIPGICFRESNKIIINEPYIAEGEPPSPYCEEYFENLHGRIAYLETSRGCPYSCAFCLSGRCGGVRFFDIERAKSEAEAIKETLKAEMMERETEELIAGSYIIR